MLDLCPKRGRECGKGRFPQTRKDLLKRSLTIPLTSASSSVRAVHAQNHDQIVPTVIRCVPIGIKSALILEEALPDHPSLKTATRTPREGLFGFCRVDFLKNYFKNLLLALSDEGFEPRHPSCDHNIVTYHVFMVKYFAFALKKP